MFWGCISGKYGKGPGMFQEKAWGSINEASYYEHTVPVIWRYIWRVIPTPRSLQFQQDGGPGHNAKGSLAWMKERGIVPIFWPTFSPDLSPIEALQERIKNILSSLDPEVHRSYPRLRAAVQRGWDASTDAEVKDLVHTMHERCAAVIAAHGWYTKY